MTELPPAPDLSVLHIERQQPSERRGWLRWLIVLLLAAALTTAAYVFSPTVFPRARTALSGVVTAPTTVERATAVVVTEGESLTVLSATGYVEAETRADVSPKITSRITELRVTEGSRVKSGEIIARLDHTDLDAQQAEAEADWRNALADVRRQQRLFEQGVIARAALDQAVASEAMRYARVKYVKALQDYTVLRAPFDGVVVAKRANVGEAVSPFGAPGQGSLTGGAIVTMVDFRSFYVGAEVSESNLRRITKEQPAEIVLDAYPDHVYHGAVRQIIPAADRQKGTVKVKVGLTDPDEKILPDLSAKVNFTSEATAGREVRRHVEVPASALLARDGVTGVFVIRGDTVSFRAVVVGKSFATGVEVKEGLAGGESLVASPSSLQLSDGQKVQVKD